jgi:nucleoside-diphosphate-sugar epimerase
MAQKPTILLTGVSGNLGLRVLEFLPDFDVIGVDTRAPEDSSRLALFEKVDLAEERSCDQLLELLRRYRPEGVAHLAFAGDTLHLKSFDREKMWHTNVAGTGRVLEAVSEHNRMLGGVHRFVYPSTALLYGPSLSKPIAEDATLQSNPLLYAVHKRETDITVQARAKSLKCKTYILRLQPFAGPGVKNIFLSALRGLPVGEGRLAARLRRRGTRFPLVLPSNGDYLQHKFQCVHVDDAARLVAFIFSRHQSDPALNILNVAGKGDPVTLGVAARIAQCEIKRVPGRRASRMLLRFLWNLGVSDVPPEALPYLLGSSVLDMARLRIFLGEDYRKVMHYTCEEALAETFASPRGVPAHQTAASLTGESS